MNQAFYILAIAASKIAIVLHYRLVPKADNGIELWSLRECYLRIVGHILCKGRTLWVCLTGAIVSAKRQVL